MRDGYVAFMNRSFNGKISITRVITKANFARSTLYLPIHASRDANKVRSDPGAVSPISANTQKGGSRVTRRQRAAGWRVHGEPHHAGLRPVLRFFAV